VTMRKTIRQLGVVPSFVLGVVLFGLAMNHIVDSWWPFDVGRLDLVRDTALNRAEAALILQAMNPEILMAFLATVLVTITGLVLPLAYILNRRFRREGGSPISPSFMETLRQSMLVGLWVAFCAWLQMNRMLGVAVAALVAGVLVLLELLLQVRMKATRVTEG
jgi:hypothetical protein